MRIFFFNTNKLQLIATYAAVFLLLAASAVMVLPGADEPMVDAATVGTPAKEQSAAPILTEPYRFGTTGSERLSLAINVDWGEEYLPDMLAVLKEYQVPVTFFVTGRWCGNNQQLVQEMAAAGHEIGNHGFSHTSPNASTKEQITEEIEKTQQAIETAVGTCSRLYAPPSGENDPHVIEAAADLGYATVLWSVDTIDWQKPAPETVVERVLGKVTGGDIILAHPTECTLAALPTIISKLQEEGYQFVTVSENLGI